MKFRIPMHLSATAAALFLAGPALAIGTLTGDDAMTAAFDPNNTAPHLELQVVGSTLETTAASR